MRILGLDPSLTAFGWALHDTEAKGAKRCISRGRFQTKKKQFPDDISRYLHLRDCLDELIEELEPDAMGIEHPVFNEDWSEGMYALFMFCQESIKGHKQDVVFFAPPQVKAFAKEIRGLPKSWKMSKSDMVDAAKDDTNTKGHWDHNEADAYHVAQAAGRFWELYANLIDDDELTPVEAHTFTKIHTFIRGKKAGKTELKGILHRESERFFLWSMA